MQIINFLNSIAVWEGFLYKEGEIESYNLKVETYSEFYHVFTVY